MLKKIYRLKEKEVKKVLSKSKPFFSYGIVLNKTKNNLNYNRFAIVIWSKSVKNNVERVFFRRKFYNFVKDYIFLSKNWFLNFVFVVKKQNKLDKKDITSIKWFEKDLEFLIKKIK